MSGIDKIKNKILVLSGKGGVGKSTVAVNTALTLKKKGYRVGLLDIDIHGPSVPHMLNIHEQTLQGTEDNKLIPVDLDGMKVISIGFLLDSDNRAVIWRGPLKYKVLMQFLNDVEWGELDYLIIDSPPGTGDEPLTILQNIKDLKGAVVVTTPQNIALIDVRKAMDMLNQMGIPVIGIVENMAGFKCAHCGEMTYIFGKDGYKSLEHDFNTKLIASIPITAEIVKNSEQGKPAIIKDDIKAIFDIIASEIESK